MCVFLRAVKMNKRMFTKKFFSLDFLENFSGGRNKLFFKKKLGKSSLFKKKC